MKMKTQENFNRREDRIYNIFNYEISARNKNRPKSYLTTLSKKPDRKFYRPFLNSAIEKKMKDITLSISSFNNYMNTYKKLTQTHTFKNPDVNFYPLTKNDSYLPVSNSRYFSSNNLNNKSSRINMSLDYKNISKNTDNNQDSKNSFNITKKWNNNGKENNENAIFEYFISGNFLRDKKIFKFLGLEDARLTYPPMEDKNFKYLNQYLISLKQTKNYDYTNEKEYIYKFPNNKNNISFKIIVNSFHLTFTEINTQKKQKKYLPFKYMILFYLLDYSLLKQLISEIIYYDVEKNEFKANQNTIDEIINKYSLYINNKLNNVGDKYNMIYKENELMYNTKYDWILYDFNNKKYKIFKTKIAFPKIKFEVNNINLKFVKSVNKFLLTTIIKNNFVQWDKYLLYDLFLTKKLRKIMTNLCFMENKESEAILYKNKKLYLSKLNSSNSTLFDEKQSLEFYITKINEKSSNFYTFVPNSITLIRHKRQLPYEENKFVKNKGEKIQLTLKESQNFYKLSKYWGIMTTLNKCISYNNMLQKYCLKFEVLNCVSKDFIDVIKKNNNSKEIKNNIYPYKFKLNHYEFCLYDCFLTKKNIIEQNKIQINYRNIPIKMKEYILNNKGKQYNKLNKLIAEFASEILTNKIINSLTEEIDIKGKINKSVLINNKSHTKNREGAFNISSEMYTMTSEIIKPNYNISESSKMNNQIKNNLQSKSYNGLKQNNTEKVAKKEMDRTEKTKERKDKKRIIFSASKKSTTMSRNVNMKNSQGYKQKCFINNLNLLIDNSIKNHISIASKNQLNKERILRNANKYRINSWIEIDELKKGLLSK